ncbi:MAG: ABC transporter permease [Methanobacteriaceae archaeon]|nr:ABC transporter permease [Methanobacteriaceae archaeon]
MIKLIKSEFLKLKGSKIFPITIIASLISPLMMLVAMFKQRQHDPSIIFTLNGLFLQTNTYVLLLFGLVIFGVIAAFLFTREYNEHTLKTILPIPVSRTKFLISKFIMLYIWIFILISVTFIGTIFIAYIGNVTEITLNVILTGFYQYVMGGSLLFLVLSPIIFIALWSKNLVPTVIVTIIIGLINLIISNDNIAAIFPWSSTYFFAIGKIESMGYEFYDPLICIFITFLIGFIASIYYFNKKDIIL